MRVVRRSLVGLFCGCAGLIATHASTATIYNWKSSFSAASSPQLGQLHDALHAPATTFDACPVKDIAWEWPSFTLRMASGTVYLEPAVEGATPGAWIEGDVRLSFKPTGTSAKALMSLRLGRAAIEELPARQIYVFSAGPGSKLDSLKAGGRCTASGSPQLKDLYLSDRSAMRQLGLTLTAAFMDREGIARGAVWALFAYDEIRGTGSEEARLLYAYNPAEPEEVTLHVFGHDGMADAKPWRDTFWPLVSFSTDDEAEAAHDLLRSSVSIALGTAAKSATEQAVLTIKPAEGARALRLDMTVQMQVSKVADQNGTALPFVQWAPLRNDPDFDQTLLVDLSTAARSNESGATVVTLDASGILFEPWGDIFYMPDEDDWAPRLPGDSEAHHELTLTIPKRLVAIGTGTAAAETASGMNKVVCFKTTQPSDQSTFYYGDYTKLDGQADNLKLELYQDRTDVQEQQYAKAAMTELTNIFKVFGRMFVPLDIPVVRVASTPTEHGRGFEGLLLLGGGGTSSSGDRTNLFRAHEVAHHWWGNYVRPKHWPQDRWLSESFAEYSAMEYMKNAFQDQGKLARMMRENWYEPLTFGNSEYTNLAGQKMELMGQSFTPLSAGSDNVYTKGPMVLGMLRYAMFVQKGNDAAFFPMLQDFLGTYRYKAASTQDFRKIAEKHAGFDLGWYFDQWYEDGGVPVVKWTHEIVPEGGAWLLKLRAKQLQKNYKLVIPIYIKFDGDKQVVRPWLIEGESAERTLKLPSKPASVSLNDGLESLVILKPLV